MNLSDGVLLMRTAKWLQTAGLLTLLFVFSGFALHANAANVTGKYATLVIDANTGKILHSYKAQELRYPASLTKMMTLYIVFELIEDQQLSYDTVITASREAASRPPSKIGLKLGDRITVRQAVKALITKSANDVAAAVAEHISGSESAFAAYMTRKARQLGMTQTVFRNASGLPNRNQVTTARDMAQLALRLRDHFPQHYRNFKTRIFHYRGRKFKNHNALLGRYRGVDGIKTGYTRASGFNLVTSVQHNRRNIVAVVMGGRTGRARNAAMRQLLTKHVKSGSTFVSRQPHTRIALQKSPKPVSRSARSSAANSDASVVASRRLRSDRNATAPAYPAKAGKADSLQIDITRVRRVDILKRSMSSKAPQDKLTNNLARKPLTQLPSPGLDFAQRTLAGSVPNTEAATLSIQNQSVIQVGAFSTQTDAQEQLIKVSTKAGNLLAGSRPLTVRAMTGAREVYRARFAGYSSARAQSTCRQLKKMGIDCFVLRSQ